MHDYVLLDYLGLPNNYQGLKPASHWGCGGDPRYERAWGGEKELFTVWLQGDGEAPSLYRHGLEADVRALFTDLRVRAATFCSAPLRLTLWQHRSGYSSGITAEHGFNGRMTNVGYDNALQKLAEAELRTVFIKGLGP